MTKLAAMDIIDPILGIAEKLYTLCGEVKANKKRCKRLADRVCALVDLVKDVKSHGLGRQPDMVRRGLNDLNLTLKSAEKVVVQYTSSSFLKRIISAWELGEEFERLNDRLNDAAQLFMLALQVEQTRKIRGVFDEKTREQEDAEDKASDHESLQALLETLVRQNQRTNDTVDAVHLTVEQTYKEVQDMKDILESLRKPSIHQLAITEIKPKDLKYDIPKKLIMKSYNSEVFKGEYNKFTVAIKRYTYPVSTSPSQIRSIFNKEVETMKGFESPHILRMFGICVEDEDGHTPNYLIVMEYCEMGSLMEVLSSPNKLPWYRKIRMGLDAAHGLYRLHQSEKKSKVHGCITSSKFLVAAGYRVKLGGFELAKTETSLKRNKDKNSSSLIYISPQQLQNIEYPYDKACEIYSLGIVLWEIATQQVPFKDCSKKDIKRKVCQEKMMEPLPKDCPDSFKELINACCSYEPFDRPEAGELVDYMRKLAEQIKEE